MIYLIVMIIRQNLFDLLSKSKKADAIERQPDGVERQYKPSIKTAPFRWKCMSHFLSLLISAWMIKKEVSGNWFVLASPKESKCQDKSRADRL